MTFDDVSSEAKSLVDLISKRTGRPLVADVTVPEPGRTLDELHFLRLVNWGYVFLNEAGGTVFRELARLLKSSRPNLFRTYHEGKRDIEALRTSSVHNLVAGSRANERTKRIAEYWLIQNGDPGDWRSYCASLLELLHTMLMTLRDAFLLLCDEGDDTAIGLNQLMAAVDNAWAPHLFDSVIEEVAVEIEIPPLDATAFRKPRQEKWVKIASLFPAREDAAIAIRRTIRAELQQIFGQEYNN